MEEDNTPGAHGWFEMSALDQPACAILPGRRRRSGSIRHAVHHHPSFVEIDDACSSSSLLACLPPSVWCLLQVYQARLNMGEALAHKILRVYPDHDIDVVIPVPDTSRTSALQCAYTLNR